MARIYSNKVLTLTFNRFTVFLIIVVVFLQGLYWEQTHFFCFSALIAHLNAYLFSRTKTRATSYYSAPLMIIFYLGHFTRITDCRYGLFAF